MERFFVVSGAILNVRWQWLVSRILLIAAVLAVIIAGVVVMFPRASSLFLADVFESVILRYGTLEEAEMLRELRHERFK